jgi:hypothetical protein
MSSPPEPWDVVVRQKGDDAMTVFVLGTHESPNLFSFDSREKAIAHAVSFAKTHHVRAWFAINETDFQPLGTFENESIDACGRCHGAAWMCNEHDCSWPHSQCPGPAAPCQECNRSDPPRPPADFEIIDR